MKEENKPVIILISGKSHVGKGEFSKKLETRLRKGFRHVIRCSLSTYIRKVLKEDFYFDDENTDESREFMGEVYRLGTKVYPYHMSRRVWERNIVPFLVENSKNFVVVESFREKLNYDYFKILQKKGLIKDIVTIRVVRPNYISTGEGMENHVSEIDLDNFEFDHYIVNKENNLEFLDLQASNLAHEIVNKYETQMESDVK